MGGGLGVQDRGDWDDYLNFAFVLLPIGFYIFMGCLNIDFCISAFCCLYLYEVVQH